MYRKCFCTGSCVASDHYEYYDLSITFHSLPRRLHVLRCKSKDRGHMCWWELQQSSSPSHAQSAAGLGLDPTCTSTPSFHLGERCTWFNSAAVAWPHNSVLLRTGFEWHPGLKLWFKSCEVKLCRPRQIAPNRPTWDPFLRGRSCSAQGKGRHLGSLVRYSGSNIFQKTVTTMLSKSKFHMEERRSKNNGPLWLGLCFVMIEASPSVVISDIVKHIFHETQSPDQHNQRNTFFVVGGSGSRRTRQTSTPKEINQNKQTSNLFCKPEILSVLIAEQIFLWLMSTPFLQFSRSEQKQETLHHMILAVSFGVCPKGAESKEIQRMWLVLQLKGRMVYSQRKWRILHMFLHVWIHGHGLRIRGCGLPQAFMQHPSSLKRILSNTMVFVLQFTARLCLGLLRNRKTLQIHATTICVQPPQAQTMTCFEVFAPVPNRGVCSWCFATFKTLLIPNTDKRMRHCKPLEFTALLKTQPKNAKKNMIQTQWRNTTPQNIENTKAISAPHASPS